MTFDLVKNATLLEDLSALADGEVEDVAALCAHWQRNDRVRAAWHAYHLIGDVLRSDDLAAVPSRDAAFLARLQTRLAEEPVVLAPAPASSRVDAARGGTGGQGRVASAWTWRTASAVAAGFVAIAGVYTVLRPFAPLSTPDAALASASPTAVPATALPATALPAPAVPATAVPPTAGAATAGAAQFASVEAAAPPPATLVLTGKLLRDAQLDAYLAAHEQFAGSSALGIPSAFLRSATVRAPGR